MPNVTDLVIPVLSNEDMEDNEDKSLLTPRKQFEQEILECTEWKENNSELWHILFKEEIDVETYAFFVLPDETKEKLRN